MTKQEIEQRFEEGAVLTKMFGIRQDYYSIGTNKITSLQFNHILNKYEGKYKFEGDFGGFTKHRYTYQK